MQCDESAHVVPLSDQNVRVQNYVLQIVMIMHSNINCSWKEHAYFLSSSEFSHM